MKLDRLSIILLSLVVFILVNFLMSPLSLKFDLSKGQAYTLSPATKKIISNLDDIVNIKFFVTSDLPTRLLPLKTDVVELLNEYQRGSRGKIIIKNVDPKKDASKAEEAQSFGIPLLQFSQLEKDKYAVSTAYFGIGLSYGGKKDAIPQVTDPENLEFNLTSSVYKLTQKEITKLGIIGDASIISIFGKLAGQQFDISPVAINQNPTEISKDISTLIIIDNGSTQYDDQQLSFIKNYLNKGGKAIFFVDGVTIGDNLEVSEPSHNLFSIPADYGIIINKNLILSTSAELVNFGSETMQFLTPYPFWLKTNSFNLKTSFFANVSQLTFPWTSSLTLDQTKKTTLKELVNSTKNSWEQKEADISLNPQDATIPDTKDLKSFVIAAKAGRGNSRIVVIPSSRFIQDRYLNQNSQNLEFVLNVLSDLTSQGALSGIRARAISFYPLPDITENQKDIFKYANILLLPVIFAIYGAVRLIRRK